MDKVNIDFTKMKQGKVVRIDGTVGRTDFCPHCGKMGLFVPEQRIEIALWRHEYVLHKRTTTSYRAYDTIDDVFCGDRSSFVKQKVKESRVKWK